MVVEGATSTAQSGYSMRLGVKALESTITEYDYTVRDGNHMIQFLYTFCFAVNVIATSIVYRDKNVLRAFRVYTYVLNNDSRAKKQWNRIGTEAPDCSSPLRCTC